jgi:hypothetical protein
MLILSGVLLFEEEEDILFFFIDDINPKSGKPSLSILLLLTFFSISSSVLF